MSHRSSVFYCARPLLLLLLTSVGAAQGSFVIRQDSQSGTISVHREGTERAILVQHARPGFRPYIHPILAPDGKGILTEYSPSHHKHQTGLYWGFTRLNGRDYFHHPEAEYWRRKSAKVLKSKGVHVKWEVAYDLLDKASRPVLTEKQTWSIRELDGRYQLDLTWRGTAHRDVTIGKYQYGGLFLRMPWKPGIEGAVTNAAGQVNAAAEGQRTLWLDVGMKVPGRDDLAHIAIFDHKKNKGSPQHWHVDRKMGVGPVRSRLGDWRIGSGQTEVIRHRLVIYTGALDASALNKMASLYIGRERNTNLWKLAQLEGRRAEFLTPEKAAAKMTLVDGFAVTVWAAEPMMTQPMAFCWDDRGRMWVAENRDYESRNRGFSNSGDSRILILEDTDRDGRADKRKVFLEGVPFPAAIAVGMGGLWLGAPPNLLFVPDRDGDDVADVDAIEVRLTGWGIRDRHETMNSFHWGPDGWLYGLEGFATPSRVGKPKAGGRILKAKEPFEGNLPLAGKGTILDGGVWRYHPTKERFEVVAHGFSNPWGIDYDAKGQLFITACVIPHAWHVVPGGYYHRQGGRHVTPYVYDDIKTIADHRHRSAHGGARIYLSDAFDSQYHGQLFMNNIHDHAVLTDVLEPVGSGFVAHHGSDFLQANNAQWIGFSMEIGPGGDVFVLDWHDADICGKEVLNKDTGRIFRISPKRSLAADWPGRYDDLSKLEDKALVALQRSKSAWHARRARLNLQGRAASGTLDAMTRPRLREMFANDDNPDWRLRAMWALHVTGGFSPGQLRGSLDDADPHVRAWAIQMLCEDGTPKDSLAKLSAMARDDRSPVVRLYLAAALSRIEHASRWPIASELVLHGEDRDDHNIPKMIWFGIEPAVPGDPNRALQLARSNRLPNLSRFIARRLTAADAIELLVAAIGQSAVARQPLLEGLRDGLAGRREVKPPINWREVHDKIKGDKAVADIATEVAQRFGDRGAAQQMLATIANKSAKPDTRRQALRSLAAEQHPALRAQLVALLDDDSLRTEAIRAVAAFDDPSLADALLVRYDKFDAAHRLAVVQTLASRPKYGRRLTKSIANGKIQKRDVPAYVARQLQGVVGVGFVEVWGPMDQLGDGVKAAFEKYRTLLTDAAVAAADPRKGRAVFARSCLVCHKMYGAGGQIGPELTGSNRADLDYILSNILRPSEEIQDAYKMVLVTMRDGRSYAGNIASEDKRRLTIRIVGQDDAVVVAKPDIQSRDVVPVSMMPAGLLSTLTDAEVLDLIAYLRTTEQVPSPDK